MKTYPIYKVCKNILFVISLIAVGAMFLLNFFYNSTVSYNAYENVTVSVNILSGLVTVGVIVAVLFLVALIRKHIEKIDPRLLFAAFSLMYGVMALYLILNVDHTVRADASAVFYTAKNVSAGNYSAFEAGGYMDTYPHQTGLLLYDTVLQIFSQSPALSFVLNFFFVLGINYFTVKTAEQLFNDQFTTVITVAVSFAFLPQLLFILFAYGLTPGCFFMCFAFYNTLRAASNMKIINVVMAVAGASLAVGFKKNFLIGAVAIGAYLALKMLKESKITRLKIFSFLISLLLLVSVPAHLATVYFEHKTDISLDEGAPSVLWIAMGTDIDNRYCGAGWYNGFNLACYQNADHDSEVAAELGRKKLENNFKRMKNDPMQTVEFFRDKTVSQWCDPMFQSAWSGPLEDCGQYTHTELLRSIYTGGTAESVIACFSKLVVLLIFGAAAIFLIFGRKQTDGWELLVAFFLGGLLFHTFWEAKSQYIYPYVFCLIPLAANGMSKITYYIKNKFDGKKNNEHQ